MWETLHAPKVRLASMLDSLFKVLVDLPRLRVVLQMLEVKRVCGI